MTDFLLTLLIMAATAIVMMFVVSLLSRLVFWVDRRVDNFFDSIVDPIVDRIFNRD